MWRAGVLKCCKALSKRHATRHETCMGFLTCILNDESACRDGCCCKQAPTSVTYLYKPAHRSNCVIICVPWQFCTLSTTVVTASKLKSVYLGGILNIVHSTSFLLFCPALLPGRRRHSLLYALVFTSFSSRTAVFCTLDVEKAI